MAIGRIDLIESGPEAIGASFRGISTYKSALLASSQAR